MKRKHKDLYYLHIPMEQGDELFLMRRTPKRLRVVKVIRQFTRLKWDKSTIIGTQENLPSDWKVEPYTKFKEILYERKK